ncbi:MAG: hypothetical protein EA397_19015 [Deltaproteobacteria bacterium]|nr:MAG: hypothetical protein EA397_19015 [Deltaproteobacteria bacterium]
MNHARFLSEVVGRPPPARLSVLLTLIAGQGFEILPPTPRAAHHPLIVPLALEPEGAAVGLLCWPTAPLTMPLPIVRHPFASAEQRWSLELIACSTDQLVHRLVALRELAGEELPSALLDRINAEGALYLRGQARASGLSEAAYRLVKIGETHAFHEALVRRHLDRGAVTAAMVTADRAAQIAPGWARAMAARAILLDELGEAEQARDSAAAALADPVWTLGHPFARIATLAGWSRISAEPFRRLAAAPSKPLADRAAHLLDAIAVEGGDWAAGRAEVATLYAQAGLAPTAALLRSAR